MGFASTPRTTSPATAVRESMIELSLMDTRRVFGSIAGGVIALPPSEPAAADSNRRVDSAEYARQLEYSMVFSDSSPPRSNMLSVDFLGNKNCRFPIGMR